MNYDLLQSLLPYLASYEQEVPKPHSIEDFFQWAIKQPTIIEAMDGGKRIYGEASSDQNVELPLGEALPDKAVPGQTIDTELAMMLTKVYRYGKGYIKKGLDGLTADEFVYLAVLEHRPGQSKMQVIEENIQEKTTGMEVINRLLKKKWAAQKPDLEDRRKSKLFLTEEGRIKFISCLIPMFKAGKIIGGHLSIGEKKALLHLLQKLHVFHEPIFLKAKDESLDSILTTYFEV